MCLLMRFNVRMAVPFLLCRLLKPSVTSRGLPLSLYHPAFHSHLLCVIIQHTGLCSNCAPPNIFPLQVYPLTAGCLCTSSQRLLLLFTALECSSTVRYPACTCRAWIILKPGQESRPPSVRLPCSGRILPGTCRRDRVAFTLQGNQWEWTTSKIPSGLKLANIH